VNRPGGRTKGRTLLIDAVLVAIAALVILVPVLELWDADLDIPLAYVRGDPGVYTYEPDAPFYEMLAKGGIDNTWFLTNPDLGAPFHQQLFDFPVGLDNLNLVGLKVLGTVTGDVGATVNIFYVLTFVAVAVSMLLVLRALGVSRAVAAVIALLYAFLPYHFTRGVPHLFLSSYWVVPLGAYLVLRVASKSPPFTTERGTDNTADDASWRVRLWNKSGVLWLLACVAIASSGAYYAAFTLLFLVVLGVVDFIARRRRRVLASAGIAIAAIGVVATFNLAPTFVYYAIHGQDTAVVRRNPSETEFEGLKISQLVLPVEHHRIQALADVQTKSTKYTPTRSERGQQLGFIGAVGFAALLVALLVAIRRDRRAPPPEPLDPDVAATAPVPPPAEAMLSMGVLTVFGILMATISGFSILLFGFGIRELRSWNRISVFIAFFAFTAVAYGLDWLRRRLPSRRWTTPAVVVGLLVVLVVGILDQVSPAVIPDYAATAARWDSDAQLVGRVERALPSGASVFELPYRYFPEAPQMGSLGPYDLVRPYLHSQGLKWSFGGMLGRDADWQASTAALPAREMLDRVAAIGFDGLLYDFGSTYQGGAASADDISAVLGEKPAVSHDLQLGFWDLRAYRRDLRDRLGADGVRALRKRALADRTVPAY
jgi:phosphoglycerol transferase